MTLRSLVDHVEREIGPILRYGHNYHVRTRLGKEHLSGGKVPWRQTSYRFPPRVTKLYVQKNKLISLKGNE